MSKRLKRRIYDLCGLNNLSKEDRIRKANSILADYDYRQTICNQIVGASHKDIEKALKAIVTTKLSAEEQENAEIERDNPEKLHPEFKVKRTVKPTRLAFITDQKEINRLINASNEPLEEDAPKQHRDYPSYSKEEMSALLDGSYNPADFEDDR